jgi:hypothetical protein
MALALEEATSLASAARVGAWVESLAGAPLSERAARVRAIEIEAATQLPEPAQHAAAAAPTRQRGLAVALIAAALGAALFFFLSRLESAEPTEPTEPTERAAASALSAPAPEVPSSTPSTHARATPPVASASAPQTRIPGAQPNIRRQPPPKNPPSNHSPSCYRQDAEGIWHIKPACL